MKTPHVIAISSALTAATILTSVALYSVLQRDNRSEQDASAPAPPSTQPTPVGQLSPTVVWTQAENDYLYDLSQALEAPERDRTTAAEKLAIGRQIQGWLDAGADYWGIREKFDATYRGSVAGTYAHNRDVYIKFATERLAPNHQDTLNPPPRIVKVPVPSSPRQPDPEAEFDGGDPIPTQTAVVIESGFLNCRAIPNGKIIGQVVQGQVLQVHRVAASAGKVWYLTTQNCWVFGGGIQFGSNPPSPNPPSPNPPSPNPPSPSPTPSPSPMPTPPSPSPTPPTPSPSPMPTPPSPSPTPSP